MATTSAVVLSAPATQPLYEIEEHLAALIDSVELVTPAEESAFREDFQAALSTAIEKRDRVGQFMAHLEQQIAFADSEIDRLRRRRSVYQQALERLEEYVMYTIQRLGRGIKGKYRKLEGKTITFSLVNCPPSVEVTDESAVPADYKTLTLRLPATAWDQVLGWLDNHQREAVSQEIKAADVSIDKRSVKAAITAGKEIPGAGIVTGKTWLKRS